jgi:diaminopimelate epimerase
MTLHFYKYQGAGNDFIIIDDRSSTIFNDVANQKKLIAFLCDRRFGIGADGLMLLREHQNYDFEMVYFNADGGESTMCGNGGRCLVAFAYDQSITGKEVQFIAVDGPHHAGVVASENESHWISLQMKDVEEIREMHEGLFLDTGSPHYVKFCDDVTKVDVYHDGKQIRQMQEFGSGGTNVNFVQISDNVLHIRTFERGVEDETLACGTGITAAAIASYYSGKISHQEGVQVKARGGDLKVSFRTSPGLFSDVYLEGPAKMVFKGEISIYSDY